MGHQGCNLWRLTFSTQHNSREVPLKGVAHTDFPPGYGWYCIVLKGPVGGPGDLALNY